ncbi:50S ribosomal protein L19-1, chloroplastic-like [Solanum pennellii]|uniref:50S ribosomal protein L19-1, chloroplastic-like n=1 Tax=Solanum pennellii TaxID=28526 RepID=A0ABM1FVR4_SOLPN|nr:50S ribosomal protein L19-1, chloroplastic-like [Solanum pennellii]
MWRRLSSQLRALTPSQSPPKCNLFVTGSVSSSSLTSEIFRPSVALYNRHFSSEFGNASKEDEVEHGNLLKTRLNNIHASLTSPYKGYTSCLSQYNAAVPSFPRRFITTGASSVNMVSEDASALATPRIKFKRLDKTAKHIMQILDKEAVEEVRAQNEIPDIKPGYIIQLKLEVPENKRRVSTIKGIVIARRNAGLNTTFRLRRLVAGVGVENLFHLYSPNLKEIKVLDKKRVRRAKLYYLRDKMNALKKH